MVHDMYIWMYCVYKNFMRVGIWTVVVSVYAGMSMYGVTLIWAHLEGICCGGIAVCV